MFHLKRIYINLILSHLQLIAPNMELIYLNDLIVENGVLHTPSLGSSNLRGITRDSIIKVSNDLGLEVIEETISRERLYLADEVFFTGTAAEVTPIRSIDHKTIGIGKRGPIAEKIQSRFFDIVEAKVEDKFGWLDYI